MDPERPLVIALSDAEQFGEAIIGGKAAKLARIASGGLIVPQGFCVTAWAYQSFVEENGIRSAIDMELGRKSMDDMRWEEIWDTALRIRSLFLNHPCSPALLSQIDVALQQLDPTRSLAVRSSSPAEDTAQQSFAGLHETILGVTSGIGVADAVRLVWASLWSDAALLYRRELGLNPGHSQMAVLVQEMIGTNLSGVAFGRDPRDGNTDRAIVESVPGPCSLLVDGLADPDRWELDRVTRQIVVWLPGRRGEANGQKPLLNERDLLEILDALAAIERKFHWPADMEWCKHSGHLVVLQARPVTTGGTPDAGDRRSWYLSLRPNDNRLRQLRQRVAEDLIPKLESEGQVLAAETLDCYDDKRLADSIEQREAVVGRWKKVYWEEFIPFAHGVRRLALYYNDAVQPEDPYEFVGLLRDQPLIAVRRNRAIMKLSEQVRRDPGLQTALQQMLTTDSEGLSWDRVREVLERGSDRNVIEFIDKFEDLSRQYLDIAYGAERLSDAAWPLLQNIMQLAQKDVEPAKAFTDSRSKQSLQQRLFDAVGESRRKEAKEVIQTGRISWRLRDDDNILVARLESQLLRALDTAAERLRRAGRLQNERKPSTQDVKSITDGLRDPLAKPVELSTPSSDDEATPATPTANAAPRQMIGQPASPGIATGLVRQVRGLEDLASFQSGEVLVCEAIQPTMTHLVPLAGAVVECRGGMLIHGAIIARELGIPCVNGVRTATAKLANGQIVTVDGYLGIVTVGEAEFELEMSYSLHQ